MINNEDNIAQLINDNLNEKRNIEMNEDKVNNE